MIECLERDKSFPKEINELIEKGIIEIVRLEPLSIDKSKELDIIMHSDN